MAIVKNLPIYKAHYTFLSEVLRVTKNFPRDYKFLIGDRLNNLSLDVFSLILMANRSMDPNERNRYITQMVDDICLIDTLLTLCCDMKIISSKIFATLIQMTENIGKQANGWKAKTREKLKPLGANPF